MIYFLFICCTVVLFFCPIDTVDPVYLSSVSLSFLVFFSLGYIVFCDIDMVMVMDNISMV